MATKKNKGLKNNNMDVALEWLDVPLATWVMDLGAYAIPVASVAELVDLVDQLADRTLVDPTVNELAAKERMMGAATLCARAIEHNAALASTPAYENQKRLRLVKLVTSMTEMVGVRARSPEQSIADEAMLLETEVFGGKLDPMRMGVRTLRVRLRAMKGRLDSQPDLRKRLEVCVPKAQIDSLFAEAARWGKETPAEAEKALPLDLRVLRAHLRQCTAEYVINVLATVRGDDPATTARAGKALAPVVELREELRERLLRRSRSKDAAEGAEVEDDEDLDLESLATEEEDDAVPTQPAQPKPPAAEPAETPAPEHDG